MSKSQISRETYKKIKAMNKEQMNDFLTGIYQEGVNDSQIDLDELREVMVITDFKGQGGLKVEAKK